MNNRWTLYSALKRALTAQGLTLNQAIDAARTADRITRERRDYCIRCAHQSGMSMRKIARVWGVDVALVHRICRSPLTDTDESQRGPAAA